VVTCVLLVFGSKTQYAILPPFLCLYSLLTVVQMIVRAPPLFLLLVAFICSLLCSPSCLVTAVADTSDPPISITVFASVQHQILVFSSPTQLRRYKTPQRPLSIVATSLGALAMKHLHVSSHHRGLSFFRFLALCTQREQPLTVITTQTRLKGVVLIQV